MFDRRYRRDREAARIASGLYGAIVAQARSAAFYVDLGVPDTVAGRFEMVIVHTVIVIERLKIGGESERAIGQRIFDFFCLDMDRSLRELGIGDLAVPRRMRQMAERFYGRADAYGRSLARRDPVGLAQAIGRNVVGVSPTSATALAAYAMATSEALAGRGAAALLDAPPVFPHPGAFARAEAGS